MPSLSEDQQQRLKTQCIAHLHRIVSLLSDLSATTHREIIANAMFTHAASRREAAASHLRDCGECAAQVQECVEHFGHAAERDATRALVIRSELQEVQNEVCV